MIYEIRTTNLKTNMVPEYVQRVSAKINVRMELSTLRGHWYTETGLLNQVIGIWSYENSEQRVRIRKEADSGQGWPSDAGDLVTKVISGIYHAAPFMRLPARSKMGPIYEMRLYTYPPEDIEMLLQAWGKAMPEREKLSSMVGCWYNESGGLNNFIHMWAYSSFEERLRIRQEAKDKNIWPPPSDARLIRQETKILLPSLFSPLQ